MPRDDKQAAAGSRADQVRSAVEGAFQAAGSQIGRDRAIDLADELASAANRVREALEELRPPTTDDLKRIGARLSAIERRLGALEGVRAMAAPPKTVTPTRPARAKAASARAKGGATKAAPKARTATPKAKQAARPTAAAAKRTSAAASKPAAKPRAAAKPKASAKPKSAAKPQAAAKPKSAAKPQAAAKPTAAAKPRARGAAAKPAARRGSGAR